MSEDKNRTPWTFEERARISVVMRALRTAWQSKEPNRRELAGRLSLLASEIDLDATRFNAGDQDDDPSYQVMVAQDNAEFERAMREERIDHLGYDPQAEEGHCQKCGRSCDGAICERCLELAKGLL